MSISVAIVGRGRMGTALGASLTEAGVSVYGPFSRDDVSAGTVSKCGADVVVLAVPDIAIAEVARMLAPGPVIGHLSGATPLDVLSPHERFVLHPLLTVTGASDRFAGAYSTVSASTQRATHTAKTLATLLGLRHSLLRETDRAAYHAAASISSNFLMTILAFAEDLASRTGLDREALVPLVHASVDNWANMGAREALTGPIVRGDYATVDRQRNAVATLMPEQLPLFDALVTATTDLASSS